MSVTGLNHVNFHGPRALLDAMRDFYRDVVGLTEGPRPPFKMFGYWLYAGGQPLVHLYEAMPDEARTLGLPETTFDHVAFSCEEAEEVEARLARLNVPHRVTTVPGTTLKQIFLTDPGGNGVELQFGERSA